MRKVAGLVSRMFLIMVTILVLGACDTKAQSGEKVSKNAIKKVCVVSLNLNDDTKDKTPLYNDVKKVVGDLSGIQLVESTKNADITIVVSQLVNPKLNKIIGNDFVTIAYTVIFNNDKTVVQQIDLQKFGNLSEYASNVIAPHFKKLVAEMK